ncbi:SufE family protein [Candidatus Clavichlamydia salmonicola]|uniref:SufE family protein n=1 Tax=Candidatus Clavichlamydia salmonicola TaxID=469812 RepID=UPI001890E917|nr:SufE family protein [Candidatus Clavichlamydia salmonicola]
MPFTTCLEKQTSLIKKISSLSQKKDIYKEIISLGEHLPTFNEDWIISKNRVHGCQSLTYLHSEKKNSVILFFAHSNALISAGMAALLLWIYNNEKAETILLCPPHFIKELNLTNLLSPGRSNGLLSIHLEMKKRALHFLTSSNEETM